MNGELVDWADATVHVGTHGLHYGTGVFEGIRCYETDKGPAVFRLTDHLDRLQNSAKLLRSEEHTSELQSHSDLVCRLLLEKKSNYTSLGDPHCSLLSSLRTTILCRSVMASPSPAVACTAVATRCCLSLVTCRRIWTASTAS